MKRSLVLFSGGLDSATALYLAKSEGDEVRAIGFDYNQRHIHELNCARRICGALGVTFDYAALPPTFAKTALTTDVHISGQAPINKFVVPCRNAVFLSVAASFAAALGFDQIVIGCNADDAEHFPDCRPEFLQAIGKAISCSQVGVEVFAPFVGSTKRQVAERAKRLAVPIDLTWSCYTPRNSMPCGTCDACLKRAAALCA